MGAPAPSITWKLDNQVVSFEQTDTVTQFEATLTGTEEGQRDVLIATPGSIISKLHIVSARYPDHDGVYTCIGTNSGDLNVASSTATISVQVQGRVMHEVYSNKYVMLNMNMKPIIHILIKHSCMVVIDPGDRYSLL